MGQRESTWGLFFVLMRIKVDLTASFCPQSPLHPIPASPTSPQSALDGSNSTLSGSASSGVSSLSESNFCPSSSDAPVLDTAPGCHVWTSDGDEAETSGVPVRYSISEPDVLDSLKLTPCRSYSAPVGVMSAMPQEGHHHVHAGYMGHYHLHQHEPLTVLPPKPFLREGCIPEEDLRPVPRPLPRKISQPLLMGKDQEQAKVAWEHGISEQ